MTMRAYKLRIYPDSEQKILLAKHFGYAQFVYNWAFFFNGLAKFLRFKSKYAGRQSFQYPQHTQVDRENARINLPKLKGTKAKPHRAFTGKLKTVTVTRTASNKYFASILIDEDAPIPISTTKDWQLSERGYCVDSKVQAIEPSERRRVAMVHERVAKNNCKASW